ncbi:hypothetical protein AB0H64_34105 [Nonomuraea sp. NPDC050733]|uniref:hypothetical protein n=1 Tax=Nonomuraea sp. NPDC050733 TaxID=3154633 RepID=UPI0033CEF122
MAAPEPPADAVDAARAWLEDVAESHASGGAAEPAPAQVREIWVSLGPPPEENVIVPSTTSPTVLGRARPRLIFGAILYDGRTVSVVREATDERMARHR